MSLTIIIAISYVAVISFVLRAFHVMRDRNISEAEVLRAEESFRRTA